MQLVCPACGVAIPPDDVNVRADLARCSACGHLARASELMADVEMSEGLQPPPGSRIAFSLDEQGNGVLEIPPAGFCRGDGWLIFFAAVWTLGITLWVAVAVGLVLVQGDPLGALIPAAFSIPFWVVALCIWTSIVNGVKERQRIELRPNDLVVARLRPIRPVQTTIAYENLESIAIELWRPTGLTFPPLVSIMRHQARTRSTWFTGRLVPCLTHGSARTYFAEDTTEAEMKWLVQVLKASVFRFSGRRV